MGIDLGRFKRNNNDDWVDWLADDPVAPSVREKMRAEAVRNASRPRSRTQWHTQDTVSTQQPHDTSQKTVSINITVPKIKGVTRESVARFTRGLYARVPERFKTRKTAVATGCLALAGVMVVGALMFTGNKEDSKGVLSDSTQNADFEYSLPRGDKTQADGEVRFDAVKKVVNYRDSIGGVPIVVSQQQLPSDFQNDTGDKLKKLAEGFAANEQITTANPTAYLGTSEKGPQTVIFSKKGLLVFIQSTKKIDNHDWAEYITNLQ